MRTRALNSCRRAPCERVADVHAPQHWEARVKGRRAFEPHQAVNVEDPLRLERGECAINGERVDAGLLQQPRAEVGRLRALRLAGSAVQIVSSRLWATIAFA